LAHGQSTIEKPVLTNRFVEALGYAAELHLHQRRKGKGQPYVGHLPALPPSSFNMAAAKTKSSPRCCTMPSRTRAVSPRLDEIREKFGDRVARIVDGCTDSYEVSGEKREWGERSAPTSKRVAHEPEDVRLVSAADKLANARRILSDYRAEGDAVFHGSAAASRARFGTTAHS